jgi:hypothetical protein
VAAEVKRLFNLVDLVLVSVKATPKERQSVMSALQEKTGTTVLKCGAGFVHWGVDEF